MTEMYRPADADTITPGSRALLNVRFLITAEHIAALGHYLLPVGGRDAKAVPVHVQHQCQDADWITWQGSTLILTAEGLAAFRALSV